MSTTPRLILYHYEGCPYCARVKSAGAAMGVLFEERNIMADPAAREELVANQGKQTVPVLRIIDGDTERWLPESEHIVSYLAELTGTQPPMPVAQSVLWRVAPWGFLLASFFTSGPRRTGLFVAGLAIMVIGFMLRIRSARSQP